MKQVLGYGVLRSVTGALGMSLLTAAALAATPVATKAPAASAPAAPAASVPGPGPGMGPGMGGMGQGMRGMGPGMGGMQGMGPGGGPRHGPRQGPGRFGPDNTPGWGLMTPAERAEHRTKVRSFQNQAECQAYIARHHEQMSARAKEKGRTPPAGPRRDPCGWLKP